MEDTLAVQCRVGYMAVHISVFCIEVIDIGYVFADDGAVQGRARDELDHLLERIRFIDFIACDFLRH